MDLIPLWINGLTPEMKKRAEYELGETAEVKADALAELKELINSEPNFYPFMDDHYLLRFLRVKKYDTKRAFKTLKNFYKFKDNYSGVLTKFKPCELKKVFDMNILTTMSKRSPSGSHISIFRTGCIDTDAVTPEEIVATIILMGELVTETDASQVCGVDTILDFQGTSLRQFQYLASPRFLWIMLNSMQDCWPYRIANIHVINVSSVLNTLAVMLIKALPKKIKEKVHFHGKNFENLHKILPKDVLPDEFGGNLGPFDHRDFSSHVFNNEAFFEKMNQYGYKSQDTEETSWNKENQE